MHTVCAGSFIDVSEFHVESIFRSEDNWDPEDGDMNSQNINSIIHTSIWRHDLTAESIVVITNVESKIFLMLKFIAA
jgi:hypothetical protein